MRIEIKITQEELDEYCFDQQCLGECVSEMLDEFLDLPGFNVHVEIVGETVV